MFVYGEGEAPHYSHQFLFCLKYEIQPVNISRINGGATTDNALLNDFFQTYEITDIERWLPYAKDKDRDGDIYLNRIYRVYLSEGSRASVAEIKEEIANLPIVHSSELEFIRKTNPYFPSDPMIGNQCSLNAVKAYDAWSLWNVEDGDIPGDPNVLLASVDTAVDWDHVDLVNNIWQNLGEDADGDGHTIELIDGQWVLDIGDLNGIDDDDNEYPDDLIGWDPSGLTGADDNDPSPPDDANPFTWSHGTHVAGTLAATTDNGIGIAAAAFNSSILSVKCARDNSGGEYVNDGYAGIQYAAKAGFYSGNVTIINCSWGGGGYSSYEQNVINNVHNNYGAVVLSSAGNDNLDLDSYGAYPAEYANVLNIAAVDCNGVKASFSNYGTSIDLSSPGVGVLSTVIDDSYENYDGTSMASPNAASCVGLLKSFYPEMENNELISRILFTADYNVIYDNNPGFPGELGEGMVDCYKAIGYDIMPNLSYGWQDLLPLGGDGDALVNPGESAELGVYLINEEGWTAAENVVGVLSCDNPGINITNGTFEYGDIESGGIGIHDTDLFVFEIASDIQIGEIEFVISITADGVDGYTLEKEVPFDVSVSLNQENWPQEFNQVQSSPLIMDINDDGQNEIMFGDYDGKFHVIGQNGMEVTGFPIDTGDDIWSSPAAADLNNDGSIEIVVTSKSKHLFIFDYEGNVLLDYDAGQFLMGTPAIGNLDEDSDLEIVVGAYSNSGDIFVINYDGSDVDGFPFDFNERVQGLALADLNNDNIDEIVYATESDNILGYIEVNNGDPLSTVLLTAGNKFKSDPSVLSIGNTFYILGGSDDNSLYCVGIDGELRFQVETGSPVQTSAGFVAVDESTLGIFFGSQDEYLYGVNLDGEFLPGWPVNAGGKVNSSPVFADMDGDGVPEVITATDSGIITVYHLDGSQMQNFPIPFGTSFISAPIVSDFDSDSDLEIFVGSVSNLTGVDFKLTGNNIGYWNMFHGNPYRNSFYNFDQGSECGAPLLADLNCDGAIDLLDIIIIVNIILEEEEFPSEYELWASDINVDNSIDIFDVITIVGIILEN